MPRPDRTLTVPLMVAAYGPERVKTLDVPLDAYRVDLPEGWPEANRLWLVQPEPGAWSLTEESTGYSVRRLWQAHGKGVRAARNAAAAYLATEGEYLRECIADRAARCHDRRAKGEL